MIRQNLHSHTQFCDGRSTMEEMIQAARKAGFRTWGFSPHAPISVDSPCNMSEDSVSLYKQEIERLRNKFPDMTILAGMEVDFINEDEGHFTAKVDNYKPDFVISSVHFIPNQEGVYYDIDGSPERFLKNLQTAFHNDLDYVVRTFWEQTIRMIKCHVPGRRPTIIGHIDKIARNASTVNPNIESEPYYKEMAEKTIALAMASDMIFEINTKQWEVAERFFPHQRYWQKIILSGHPYVISSDAHHVDKISSGMNEAMKLLKEYKLVDKGNLFEI
ncbi:MAG: histidinol-phosphatase [Muribaculaceae bacterium]|nr:histidinol-phosphatase [Muribaculaceae bacterium]